MRYKRVWLVGLDAVSVPVLGGDIYHRGQVLDESEYKLEAGPNGELRVTNKIGLGHIFGPSMWHGQPVHMPRSPGRPPKGES